MERLRCKEVKNGDEVMERHLVHAHECRRRVLTGSLERISTRTRFTLEEKDNLSRRQFHPSAFFMRHASPPNPIEEFIGGFFAHENHRAPRDELFDVDEPGRPGGVQVTVQDRAFRMARPTLVKLLEAHCGKDLIGGRVYEEANREELAQNEGRRLKDRGGRVKGSIAKGGGEKSGGEDILDFRLLSKYVEEEIIYDLTETFSCRILDLHSICLRLRWGGFCRVGD
ncbi:Uncharacterized protein Fot_17231 [Forsythia ovata]|uniref:Uncharacterized protein n=1 Tax=Forsythia ovata TaxID=205694 RepID=A0ABD1VES7_9LAMI